MNKSLVVNQNKEMAILNMVSRSLWYGNDIKEDYEKQVNYYHNMQCLTNDIGINGIKELYINYCKDLKNDKKVFDNFIKKIKGYHCGNVTNKNILKKEELDEYFNNINELYLYIINNVCNVIIQ